MRTGSKMAKRTNFAHNGNEQFHTKSNAPAAGARDDTGEVLSFNSRRDQAIDPEAVRENSRPL
jgi:hypothetical protein